MAETKLERIAQILKMKAANCEKLAQKRLEAKAKTTGLEGEKLDTKAHRFRARRADLLVALAVVRELQIEQIKKRRFDLAFIP